MWVVVVFQLIRPWNMLYLKIEYTNWAAFLHADSDAITFDYTGILHYIFWLLSILNFWWREMEVFQFDLLALAIILKL